MLSRRRFITAATVGGAVTGLGVPGAAAAELKVIEASDLEYPPLILRGYNVRFSVHRKKIFLPPTAKGARIAVARSMAEGLPIAVRSGGHCFEDFVDSA
jgi:hypothetical protein